MGAPGLIRKRLPPPEGDAALRPRTALRAGVLALLVLAPLPFGSVEPVFVFLLELSAAALGAIALYVVARDPASLPRSTSWLLAGPALLVLLGFAQLVPLGEKWPAAAPAADTRAAVIAAVPDLDPAVRRSSLSPADTADAVARVIAYGLLGIAALVAFRERAHRLQAAAAIALSGAFQALYGSAEYLSGHQHIFGYAKRFYLDEATGTFVNRNHFAGYLAMSLPLALALALPERRVRARGESFRKRFLRWTSSSGPSVLFAALATVAMWIGVILSYSRTGLAAALAGTLVLGVLGRMARRSIPLIAVVLLVPTLALLWLQIRTPGERFAALADELGSGSGRLAVWATSLSLVPAHPVLGHGLGTFESVYEPHQDARAPLHYDHAHNDWIEVLLEGGALGFFAIAWLCFLLTRHGLRLARAAAGRDQLIGAAALAGVAALSFHSLTDFCIRIPATALLAVTEVALAAGACASPQETVPFAPRETPRR